jgi:hypothetical protein
VVKIPLIEGRSERPLMLESKLLAPWAAELRTACEKARADLQKRELVIDLKKLTAISQEGEKYCLS